MQSRKNDLACRIREDEQLPDYLTNGMVETIFKNCDRSNDMLELRPIPSLSSIGKTILGDILNHLKPIGEAILPEPQSGFRTPKVATAMIFNRYSPSREEPWTAQAALRGISRAHDSSRPNQSTSAMKDHQNIWVVEASKRHYTSTPLRQASHGSAQSAGNEAFQSKNWGEARLHWGSQIIISIPSSCTQHHDRTVSSWWALVYHKEGRLFNSRRLQSKTKTTPTSVVELQLAADALVCAYLEREL